MIKLNANDIDSKIIKEHYIVPPDTTLTICILTLENGYVVTGESACVNKETFHKEIGEQLARKKARDKVWELEGYLLKNSLFLNDLPRMEFKGLGTKIKDIAIKYSGNRNSDGLPMTSIITKVDSTIYEYFNHETRTHYSMEVKTGELMGPVVITTSECLVTSNPSAWNFYT